MSQEATRAPQSTEARAVAIRPETYMTAARQLRSETISASAGSVLARTAQAIRSLLAPQPVALRRSRPA